MIGYRIVALTVSSAMFMQYLDSSALYTAIPAIARDFGVPAVDLNLAILSYQLSMTVLIPVGSAIAERIGHRNAFAFSLLIFMTGSILCALCTSLPALVAARALQGAGGAVMTPVSRLLVVRSADKSELISAMNWLLLPGIIGPMLGPAVSGLIVTHSSWHWIFLVNLPVALIAMVMTFIVVPDIRDVPDAPLDLKGIVLIGPAIFTLMFGLESLADPHVGWLTPALLGGGLVLLWLFIRHAGSAPAPVLDLSLFRIASYRDSITSAAVLRTVAGASGFIIPLWFQLGMGMSVAQAGALMIASATGVILSRLLGVRLTQLVHPRNIAIGGAVLMVVGLLISARMEADWPLPAFFLVLALQGVAVAACMMVLSAVTYLEIEPQRMSQASGLFTTIQQLTMSLGVTLAVWTMSGLRLFYDATEHDSRVYSGSLMMLALLAVVGLQLTRKLDVHSTAALRRSRR